MNSERATLSLALSHHRKGQTKQAARLYRQVLAKRPNQPDALHLLGMISIQEGNNEEAVKLIRKAISNNNKSHQYYSNLAVALQNLGRNEEAILACHQAIALKADDFSAYNTLGNALRALGKSDQAVENFKKALMMCPHAAEIHLNLGKTLKDLGRFDEAEECFLKAIAINKNCADGYFHLGILYRSRGAAAEAANNLLRAVETNAQHAEAYNILGNVLVEQEKIEAAAVCYKNALRIRPQYIEAHYNLGNLLIKQEQFAKAVDHFHHALAVKPDFAEALCKAGYAFLKQEKPVEAAEYFKRALSIKPNMAEALNCLGNALREQGKPEEAIKAYHQALVITPDCAEVHYNISNALFDQGRLDEAVESCHRALSIKPDFAEAHWNIGLALLTEGDYAHGWQKYEWRFMKQEESPAPFSYPCWDGSSLKGETLLVFSEQGIGDEIMFASCLPEIVDEADLCVIECDKRLIPLFSRSFPKAKFIARVGKDDPIPSDLPHIDMQVAIGSLPLFLRPDHSSFPQRTSYLYADERDIEKWRRRFDGLGSGLNVGISWRGGKGLVRRIRSTTLDRWVGLFSIPGIHFVNLQYGECRRELQEIRERLGITIHDWEDADPLVDLDGFAAKISALDLVISVDNSTVHLAGALGVPVWVLLPFVSEWRWLLDREETVWYSRMRLFRQREPGNWQSVFEQLKELLSHAAENNSLLTSEGVRSPVKSGIEYEERRLHAKPRKGIALLNDTTHWYHWGCTGTSTAIHQALSERGYYINRIPITSFYYCKKAPQESEHFDDPVFFRNFIESNRWLVKEIESMDLIVVNGEGSLHGDSAHVLNLLYLAYASKQHLGKPVHIINHSCYPENTLSISVSSSSIWEMYKKVYTAADFIAIREPISYDLMQKFGIPVTLSFDCLPLYITKNYNSEPQGDAGTVVIGGSVAWQDVSREVFAAYIDHLNRRGFQVQVLTGSSILRASDDEAFVKDLLAHCPGDWEIIEADSIKKWLDTIAQASLLISGRFHHTIAAAVLGTPFILLESNTPKNIGLAKSLDAPPPLSYNATDLFLHLLQRTESVLNETPLLKPTNEHNAMVEHLCNLALKNFIGL